MNLSNSELNALVFEGTASDINLTADFISLTNSSTILSDSSSTEEGTAGDINIDASSIFIADKASIQTQTDLIGASNINIKAIESVEINGLDSSISSQTGGAGDSGNISVVTSELNVFNGGQVSANNFITESFEVSPEGELIRNILEQPQEGSGNAGTIEITANNINLEDRGGIVALSSAGEGGNINLRVDDILSLRGNGEISATAGELNTPGNGGNINIDSKFIIAFPQGDNDITANAFDGKGGNVTIATEGIFGIEERSQDNPSTNDITASSDVGVPGDVLLETLVLDPVQGASQLPTNIVVPEETTAQACRRDREIAAQNGFSIEGRGGITPEPGLPLNSNNIYVGGESDPTSSIPAPIETAQGKIQLARGIKVAEDGTIILTAYRTNNAGDRLPDIKPNCS